MYRARVCLAWSLPERMSESYKGMQNNIEEEPSNLDGQECLVHIRWIFLEEPSDEQHVGRARIDAIEFTYKRIIHTFIIIRGSWLIASCQ